MVPGTSTSASGGYSVAPVRRPPPPPPPPLASQIIHWRIKTQYKTILYHSIIHFIRADPRGFSNLAHSTGPCNLRYDAFGWSSYLVAGLSSNIVAQHAISVRCRCEQLLSASRKRLEAARVSAVAAKISTFASTTLKKLLATTLCGTAMADGVATIPSIRPIWRTERTFGTEAASPSCTHTPTKSFKQINGRRRQAHNAGAEHTKRA